jgi:hypothetical protein
VRSLLQKKLNIDHQMNLLNQLKDSKDAQENEQDIGNININELKLLMKNDVNEQSRNN